MQLELLQWDAKTHGLLLHDRDDLIEGNQASICEIQCLFVIWITLWRLRPFPLGKGFESVHKRSHHKRRPCLAPHTSPASRKYASANSLPQM